MGIQEGAAGLELSLEFYRSLLDQMTDGVYFVDRERKILYWNDGAARLAGYTREEMVGQHCWDNILCHVDQRGREVCTRQCPLTTCIADGQSHESELFLLHKKGSRVPVSVRSHPIRDGEGRVVGAVEIFTDNTKQQEARRRAEAMERLAFHDAVTHGPNRRFLERALEEAISNYRTHGERFGILLVDLNSFKEINDGFGHAAGDRALQEVARTLTGAVRSEDVVGRWGGDEFLVLVRGVGLSRLKELADRCEGLIAQTSFLDDEGVRHGMAGSVGAAVAEGGDDVASLLSRADRDMYRVKSQGPVRS